MTIRLQIFDAVLVLTMVAIALRALLIRDLFQSIVLFIVFGLTLTIAWCRLEALDVALAEAAIGAGLTGALLLNTLAATRGREADRLTENEPRGGREQAVTATSAPTGPSAISLRPTTAIGFVATAILVAVPLSMVVVPFARSNEAPRISIEQALPESGVTNPVTAVLLNFRAYDTLLEVFVLFAAVIAVSPATLSAREYPTDIGGPVLRAFIRFFIPLTVLVAAYVLWAGTKAPGGAFQAAAILAAGSVLLIVSGANPPSPEQKRWRVLLVSGLAMFLLVGWSGIVVGGQFLEIRPPWAGPLILLIETVLTGSLALILVLLFRGTSLDELEHVASREVTK